MQYDNADNLDSDFAAKLNKNTVEELSAMSAKSYERAYSAIIMAQHLTELKKLVPERRPRIAVVWSRRLQGISLDVVDQ
uniref:PIK-related kinase FAT domain-containing protein n=1 Tax=Panagrolaimus davidi TaxID=227884 RepID=A0A914R330_9BILA